jgi:hypothetical protein
MQKSTQILRIYVSLNSRFKGRPNKILRIQNCITQDAADFLTN